MTVNLTIDWGKLPADLAAISDPVEYTRLVKVGTEAARDYLVQYLFRMDNEHPNAMGGTRTHFYRGVAGTVQTPRVVGRVGFIDIGSLEFAQRVRGGPLAPVNGPHFLTIPARPEAYGHRAGEFDDLRFVVLGRGGPALVQTDRSEVKLGKVRKDGTRKWIAKERGGLVMFWLRLQVNQPGDESLLPTEEELLDVCTQAMMDEWSALHRN